MNYRQRMSATWAWNTVTPWSSRAAQMALSAVQERSVVRRASGWGGRGHGQAAPRKLGPSFPKSVAGRNAEETPAPSRPPGFSECPGPTSLELQRTPFDGASRAASTERQE